MAAGFSVKKTSKRKARKSRKSLSHVSLPDNDDQDFYQNEINADMKQKKGEEGESIEVLEEDQAEIENEEEIRIKSQTVLIQDMWKKGADNAGFRAQHELQAAMRERAGWDPTVYINKHARNLFMSKKKKAEWAAKSKAEKGDTYLRNALSDNVVLTTELRRLPSSTFKFKILISFIQIHIAIQNAVTITWPRGYVKFLSLLDFVQLDFIPWNSVSCVMNLSYFIQFAVSVTVPVAIFLLCLAIANLVYCRDRLKWSRQQRAHPSAKPAPGMRREFIKGLLFAVFLVYPTLCRVVMEYVTCDYVVDRYLLHVNYRVECFTGEWTKWSALWLASLILYPIGIPLVLFLLLLRIRTRQSDPRIMYVYGFLYGAYTPSHWWLEVYDMLNKLFLTGVLGLFPATSQGFIGMVVVYAYMLLFLLQKPMLRELDGRLQLLALNEILLTLILSAAMRQDVLDLKMDRFLSVVLIALTCLVFLLSIFFVFQTLRVRRLRNKKSRYLAVDMDLQAQSAQIQSYSGFEAWLNASEENLELYRNFMMGEFSEENVDFWNTAKMFRMAHRKLVSAAVASGRMNDKEAQYFVSDACKVFFEYLDKSSPKLINVSNSMQKSVLKAFKELGLEDEEGRARANASPNDELEQMQGMEVPLNYKERVWSGDEMRRLFYVFDDPQREVMSLMFGTASRFGKSPFFLNRHTIDRSTFKGTTTETHSTTESLGL